MTNFSQSALLIYFKHIACSYVIITYYYYYYYYYYHNSYYYYNVTIVIYPLETRLNSSSEIEPKSLDYRRRVGEIGGCM